jgi:hypothetical protein
MEITEEVLDKQLAEFSEQHKNLVAQANALSGAIQAVELMKKKLMEPALPPFISPVPPGPMMIPPGLNEPPAEADPTEV